MDYISEIVNTFWFVGLTKILLSAILTGVIGLERSSLKKPAGLGTHAILGVSATLVVLLSEYMSFYNGIDMSRIPAQLLSGIGFIGAGTILRDGLTVKGVTTASGLLSVTCIGLCVGSGFYFGAIIATIIVYLLLAYSHNLSDRFERYAILDIEISIIDEVPDTLNAIEKYLAKKNVEIKGIKRPDKKGRSKKSDKTGETIEIYGTYDARYLKKTTIVEDLIDMDNISSVVDSDED